MTVFNTTPHDYLKEPMFFGAELNTARYDVNRYPIFDKLVETQLSFFWRPEEVSLTKDSIDYKHLSEHERFIFLSNLKYQTLLDSVQTRSPNLAFLPFASLPEVELAIVTWTFFEGIHSRAYSYIMRNLVPNPAEIFDTIVIDPAIVERAKMVTQAYDDFIDYANHYRVYGFGDWDVTGRDGAYQLNINSRELKRRLFLAMVSVNILEGVRFYASFACSFAFKEVSKMEGNAKIIALIARDEFQHLAVTQNIIKLWRRGEEDPEMASVIEECEPQVYELFDAAVDQEKRWCDHLFQHGSIIGLNATLLKGYVEHIANKRLRTLGYKQRYETTKNPLGWVDKHLNSEGNQPAPQETEIESYLVGQVDTNVPEDAFKDFQL